MTTWARTPPAPGPVHTSPPYWRVCEIAWHQSRGDQPMLDEHGAHALPCRPMPTTDPPV